MPFTVIYTRVSTDEQAKTGLSLKNQERACRAFAGRSGFEVLEVFCEEGASAKSTERKQLKRMLDFCRQNKDKVESIIVWKVDRFARKAEDHLALRAFLLKLNIRLLSATEHIEDTSVGRLTELFLAGIAQFDNEMRTERSTGGLRARIEQGGWVTYAPLGYKNIKDFQGRPTLEAVPGTSKLIRKIFEEYATGNYTLKEMADYSYKIGLRARHSNGRVSLQTIANILRNVAFIGHRVNYPSGEVVRALHKPIISEELFNKVQLILKGKHKEFRSDKDTNWPLRSGFLRCSECKAPLTGSSPGGRNKHYPKYSCPKCRTSLTGKPVSADRETVHNEFKSLLESIRPKTVQAEIFRKVVLMRWNNEYKELTITKKRIDEDTAALQIRRERVMDLFIDDKISEDEKDRQLAKIDSSRVALRIERSELEQEVDDREIVIDIAIDFMRNISSYWHKAPLELQRRFQMLVFPEGIEYEFGAGFRTAKIGLSYEVIKNIATKNSNLVGDTWLQWNQIRSYLVEVYKTVLACNLNKLPHLIRT